MNLFLALGDLTANLTTSEAAFTGGLLAGAIALAAGVLIALLLYVIVMYVAFGYSFMKMGKKAKLETPGLAWIPFVGPHIISYQASGMHWWPWLLIVGFFIPVISSIASLVFAVFTVIWCWRLLEKVGKPGWWSILFLIPVVNIVMALVASKD